MWLPWHHGVCGNHGIIVGDCHGIMVHGYHGMFGYHGIMICVWLPWYVWLPWHHGVRVCVVTMASW